MTPRKDLDSPHLAARRTWNHLVGNVVAAAGLWQKVAIFSLVVAAVSVAGMISVAKQSRFVPYVIEVDKLGNVSGVEPASRMTPSDTSRVIKAMLTNFITKTRIVTPDQTLQAASIRDVYAMLAESDPATGKLNRYYQDPETNPFKRADKILVAVSLTSIVQQTEQTWQVDWTETQTTRAGEPKMTLSMRAMLTVYMAPNPRATEVEIQRNPIGLYIKDYNWTKVDL